MAKEKITEAEIVRALEELEREGLIRSFIDPLTGEKKYQRMPSQQEKN
jgi:DNA-binding PadR family transcriptional regulator